MLRVTGPSRVNRPTAHMRKLPRNCFVYGWSSVLRYIAYIPPVVDGTEVVRPSYLHAIFPFWDPAPVVVYSTLVHQYDVNPFTNIPGAFYAINNRPS